MKGLKRSKGITLVALVVTIIVLLILAGVTLSLVAGENGILRRATNAVEINEKATAEEQANLLVADLATQYYEEKYVNQKEVGEIDEYLKTELGTQKETDGGYIVIADAEGKVGVSKGGNSISSGVIANGKVNWTGGNAPTPPKPDNPTERKGETADELVARIEKETTDFIAGREVTYIKYKDKDGNQQNKWIIVYIGKNVDIAEDVADDMPADENHIYLLPKYSVTQIAPSASKITINNTNGVVETGLDTTAGYSSTPAFKDAMRDANMWSAFAVGQGSKAHGAMSVSQYYMCGNWCGYATLGNGTFYWLDDPTWSNAIARVDGDGFRSGNGLEYWWNGAYTLRPFVMLGSNCKLASDNTIIY